MFRTAYLNTVALQEQYQNSCFVLERLKRKDYVRKARRGGLGGDGDLNRKDTGMQRYAILATVGRGASFVETFWFEDGTENEVGAFCVNLASNTNMKTLSALRAILSSSVRYTLFGDAKATCPALRALRFNRVHLDSEDLGCLLKGLQLNKTLEELTLPNNLLGDEGIRILEGLLGNAVVTNPPVKKLRLEDVGMGSEGVRCLMEGWLEFTFLERLNLYENLSLDIWGEQFFLALKEDATDIELKLSKCYGLNGMFLRR